MHARNTFDRRKEHKELFKKSIMFNQPQIKGVVLKTIVKRPKKPNSGNRKCVVVRLSNGKQCTAYGKLI